ncbi:hypothetical protein KEM52_004384 [Ascosphaera acerosa]|nr:hypothetical protein KEM52_004384 [Ascosphaera acerosa]
MPLAGSHPPLHGGYAVASGAGQYLSPLYPQPYLPLPLQPLPYSYGMGRPPGPPSPHQQRPQPGQPQPRQQQPQPAVFIAQINVAIWIRRIWTLVRLIAMLYLFDAGGGDSLLSRNTLLVLAIALCFMQGTPIPGMLREAFMGPIQRQVNQLLPVDDGHEREAGDEQRAGHAGQHHGRLHGGDDSGGDGAAVGAARPVPPQATAAAAPPATQGRFRSLQQSIMLFVATLVPGVGERQIAQRLALREAVARRRRAEESSAEREQVQQAQQQREQATAALADNRRGSDTGQTTATQVAREGESDARSTAETARMRSESSPAGSGTGGASE